MTGKTIQHWSNHLGVSTQTVWRWITSGITTQGGRTITLEAIRLGGRWRVKESAIRNFINQSQVAQIASGGAPTSALSLELEQLEQARDLARPRPVIPAIPAKSGWPTN